MSAASPVRIGIDTGGTFTDFVLLDAEGFRAHKVRSTPADPAAAIARGLADLVGREAWRDLVHGSTVATNALLQRRGARVALVVTEGFEDVLRIGRQARPALYDLQVDRPPPLVDGDLTFGLSARMTPDGSVLEEIRPGDLERLAQAVRAQAPDAAAICLLHSYENPAHERAVAARLGGVVRHVSASHEILREYREFERCSTTVANAFVTPLVARHLDRLEAHIGGARLRVMQSNGGSMSAAAAKVRAVHTVLSGPAGGVVGAQAVGRAAGHDRMITFDMGGTSTDVCLVDGAIGVTADTLVGDVPIRVPVIDIHTVGAGGGSIAYVDSGGALRVGPQSAGAEPGPACYGDGEAFTVTDAHLLLGRLDPELFLGGRMTLSTERARAAAAPLAARLNLDPMVLAEGVLRVATVNMERAIRVVSVQRGHDPRDFALVAFGGAGGMHACDLADRLDIARVIVPRQAGVLSALGMLMADAVRDHSLTVLRPVQALGDEELDRIFEPLVARAAAELGDEGFDEVERHIERTLDVRYVGQSFEIGVPWAPGFRDAFDRAHERLYGYADPSRAAEIVNVRVRGIGRVRKPELPRLSGTGRVPEPAHVRTAHFGGRATPAPVFLWHALGPGGGAQGPAVIAGDEATVVVPPGYRFEVDALGNVLACRAR